jgi:hypothetical protein
MFKVVPRRTKQLIAVLFAITVILSVGGSIHAQLTKSAQNAIAVMDSNPVQPAVPFTAHDDFQLLDSYVALNIKNNQISFGRQSMWWGPGRGSALMFNGGRHYQVEH